MKSKGAKQNHIPDFCRLFLGPEITWNFDDFMTGANFGTKEYKYNFDISTGLILRPYATRILLHDTGNIYYQYWERRNFVYIGINKNVALSRFNKKIKKEITFGIKELYNFGVYRGTVLNVHNDFLLAPEIGLLIYLNNVQLGAIYQYVKFNVTGVSPNRININAKFIFGGGSKSKAYKPWE